MKKLLLLLAVLATSFALTSCGGEKEFDATTGKIVVGLECGYAPFNWTEASASNTNHPINGTNLFAEGYDVQIAKLIAEDLGLELVIEKLEWDNLITSLRVNKIDMIIAGMSPTAERKEVINFSNSYYTSNHVVVVAKDGNYAGAKTFEDLTGAKACGQKGTLYSDLVDEIGEKNANVKIQTPLDSVNDIVIAMKAGTTDLTVVEEPVAKGIIASNPSLAYIELESAFNVSEEDIIVSIGTRKIDNDLLTDINESLAKITLEQRTALMEQAVEAQN